jgi:hypothetical protein
MVHTKRVWFSLLTALLIAAVASPALARSTVDARPASEQFSPDSPAGYVSALRHSVSPADLAADYQQTADWLTDWTAQRPQRPPVDIAQQSQKTAKWTIMVHVAADNNLEVAGLMDVNEMEAVGSSPDVNILVQMDRSADYVTYDGDWTDTRRFYIQQDDDPQVINSPVVQDLGETDTGSPQSVSDFAIWGITNYPAEKYMLIMWDHGGAWISQSSDEDSGNDISLPEFVSALENIKTATGIDKFEAIGFDMCLMAQLEVMDSIAPYARYGIGSEENEPGAGWSGWQAGG